MKKLLILGAVALLATPVTAAFARVPTCDGPDFGLTDSTGKALYNENELAQQGELQLRAQGIDANQTRFWNGCLQTFVTENGHETMRFYDPDSLREVPAS